MKKELIYLINFIKSFFVKVDLDEKPEPMVDMPEPMVDIEMDGVVVATAPARTYHKRSNESQGNFNIAIGSSSGLHKHIAESVIPAITEENSWSGAYTKINKFVSVNRCQSCAVVGYELDLLTGDPCPRCGGKMKRVTKAHSYDGKQWFPSKV